MQTTWNCGIAQSAASFPQLQLLLEAPPGVGGEALVHPTRVVGVVDAVDAAAPSAGSRTSSIPSTTLPEGLALSITGPAMSTSDWPFLGFAASRWTSFPTRPGTRSAAPVITVPP